MRVTQTTVRGLLKMKKDIDVIDDIDESVYVTMSGPIRLSAVGKAKFAALMPVHVEIYEDDPDRDDFALIRIEGSVGDGETEKESALLKQAYELFWGAAGFCTPAQYGAWFDQDPLATVRKGEKGEEYA